MTWYHMLRHGTTWYKYSKSHRLVYISSCTQHDEKKRTQWGVEQLLISATRKPGIGLNLFEHLQEVCFFMELNLMFEILANLNSFVDDMGTPHLDFIEILNVGTGDVLSAFLLLMATVGQLIISWSSRYLRPDVYIQKVISQGRFLKHQSHRFHGTKCIFTYMKGQFSMVQFSCRFSYTKLVAWKSYRVLVLRKIGSFTPVTLIFELCEGQISTLPRCTRTSWKRADCRTSSVLDGPWMDRWWMLIQFPGNLKLNSKFALENWWLEVDKFLLMRQRALFSGTKC